MLIGIATTATTENKNFFVTILKFPGCNKTINMYQKWLWHKMTYFATLGRLIMP